MKLCKSFLLVLAARRMAANGFIAIAGMGRPRGQVMRDQFSAQPLPADLKKEVEGTLRA